MIHIENKLSLDESSELNNYSTAEIKYMFSMTEDKSTYSFQRNAN